MVKITTLNSILQEAFIDKILIRDPEGILINKKIFDAYISKEKLALAIGQGNRIEKHLLFSTEHEIEIQTINEFGLRED